MGSLGSLRKLGRVGPAAVVLTAAVLAASGCQSSPDAGRQSSSPTTATAEAGLSVPQACGQVDALLDPVTEDPTAEQAGQLKLQLDSIAARSPKEVAIRIADLATALVQASTAPDGFAPGSPTESQFVLAGQELRIVCEPEGTDPTDRPTQQ